MASSSAAGMNGFPRKPSAPIVNKDETSSAGIGWDASRARTCFRLRVRHSQIPRTMAMQRNHDTTVVKIDSKRSPRGDNGEKYLASGVRVAMRLWEGEAPGDTGAAER